MRRDIKKFVSDIWKVFGEDNFGTTPQMTLYF